MMGIRTATKTITAARVTATARGFDAMNDSRFDKIGYFDMSGMTSGNIVKPAQTTAEKAANQKIHNANIEIPGLGRTGWRKMYRQAPH